MTLEEAKKVAAIAATADGGCQYCVEDMFDQLNENFPEFEWDSYNENMELVKIKQK